MCEEILFTKTNTKKSSAYQLRRKRDLIMFTGEKNERERRDSEREKKNSHGFEV